MTFRKDLFILFLAVLSPYLQARPIDPPIHNSPSTTTNNQQPPSPFPPPIQTNPNNVGGHVVPQTNPAASLSPASSRPPSAASNRPLSAASSQPLSVVTDYSLPPYDHRDDPRPRYSDPHNSYPLSPFAAGPDLPLSPISILSHASQTSSTFSRSPISPGLPVPPNSPVPLNSPRDESRRMTFTPEEIFHLPSPNAAGPNPNSASSSSAPPADDRRPTRS